MESIESFVRLLKQSPYGAVFNPWWQVDKQNDIGRDAPAIRRRQLNAYLRERLGKAKFALIGASLSYGVALMVARRFKGVPSPVIATGQLTASTIIMIPVVLLAHGPAGLFSASPPVWAAVLALALLSTAFAYILYFNLVASAGATNASLVTLIVPASAMLLGFLFLGERLELFEIGGVVLIGLGLVTIDGRVFGRR